MLFNPWMVIIPALLWPTCQPYRDWRYVEEFQLASSCDEPARDTLLLDYYYDCEYLRPCYVYITSPEGYFVDSVQLQMRGDGCYTCNKMNMGRIGPNTWRAAVGDFDNECNPGTACRLEVRCVERDSSYARYDP